MKKRKNPQELSSALNILGHGIQAVGDRRVLHESVPGRSIRLLKPIHRSAGEEPQVFLWPHAAVYANVDAGEGVAQPAFSYFFSWEPILPAPKNMVYDLLLSGDREFNECISRKNIDGPEGTLPEANILNLQIGALYYWKVIARVSGRAVASSPVRFFKTSPIPPRWIYVPGMYNVRDIGGWPLGGNRRVRQGLIYRSSELAGKHWNITDEGKRILTGDLGIRTDLDLRGSGGEAKPALNPAKVKWINIPVKAYDILSSDSRESYCRVFKVFAEPSNYPIIFHCQGGCDRGGTVSFLLHALLGLERRDLIRDYELSNRAASWRKFQELLNALCSFGNRADGLKIKTERYLREIGISERDIKVIQADFIERLPGGRG